MSDLEKDEEDEVQLPCEEENAETANDIVTNVVAFDESINMKVCGLKEETKKRNLKFTEKDDSLQRLKAAIEKKTHP